MQGGNLVVVKSPVNVSLRCENKFSISRQLSHTPFTLALLRNYHRLLLHSLNDSRGLHTWLWKSISAWAGYFYHEPIL